MKMAENEDKLNRIEELKRKLYSKDQSSLRPRPLGVLHKKRFDTPEEWGELPKEPEHKSRFTLPTSVFKKMLYASLIFLLCAVGFTYYMFNSNSRSISTENIDIKVLGNSFTSGGDELPLQVEITNANNVDLEFAYLNVEYPKGANGEAEGNYQRDSIQLGTIGAGKSVSQNIKVTLFGDQGSSKDIKLTLQYRLAGESAEFNKEDHYAVAINSAPVTLAVEAPTEATPNQEITLKAKVTLNAKKTAATNMMLKVDYPPGFQFETSTPNAFFSNNIWTLGDMQPGSEKDILIKGLMLGQEGEAKSFHFYTGEGDPVDQSKIATSYTSALQTINIQKPFIDAHLTINGLDQDTYSVPGTIPLSAHISWTNNLPIRLNDVTVTAKLSGNAFDRTAVRSDPGFYDSVNNQIIWDKNTIPDLASIDPGQRGGMDFSLTPLPLLSGNHTLINSPQITIAVNIVGTQTSEGNVTTSLTNSQTATIKISTGLQLVSKALYGSGPIQNSGPIPPKAEQSTTYTIVWTITNTSNQVSNAQVKGTIPSYIVFNSGSVTPKEEDVTFNQSTSEVSWNAGTIAPGMGFTKSPREVAFQVTLKPSLSQVATTPTLLGQATLTGTDAFTGEVLKNVKNALTTYLSGDPTFNPGTDTVVR